MRDADAFMASLGLPVMQAPAGLGGEYSFPSDVGSLNGAQLGTLQLRLTGWYTWLLRAAGRSEAELEALETTYKLALQKGMEQVQAASGSDKRIVNDILIARALERDPRLKRIAETVIGRRARFKMLETQVEIYHEQLIRLSREQSRRESEAGLA